MERGYWIRSKPIYTALVWHEKATSHVVVAQGSGGMAVLKIFQQMHPSQPITVLYARQSATGSDYSATLEKVVPEGLHLLETEREALDALQEILPACRMGTRIYVAGSEGFIWSAAKVAADFGVDDSAIMKELTGTLARTVYCVHCKAITHDVNSNIVACSGCAKKLFVRDHFSRRLGAYMGLMVDAENPGEIPVIEEIYP